MSHRTPKILIATVLAAVACLSCAAAAFAGVPGRNGRIAFTSGREGANDNLAQLYMLNPSRPTPLGSPFSIAGTQNRHPSFSPDRTKVVFAAGTPGPPTTEEFDLFVKDMITGSVTPLDGLQLGDGLSSDHPAWSPDGTRIAYETQPVDNSEDRDIRIKTVGTAAAAVSLTQGGPVEFKPAWSPDSQEIFYAYRRATPAVNFDIVKKPATGTPATAPSDQQANPMVDDYQPAISPDGTKVCFTIQSTPQNAATAEIYVADFPTFSNGVNYSNDATRGDINCVFSPDSKRIAYSNGVFSQGRLVTKRIGDPAAQPTELADDQGSNNFDGNADWAPDGSPDCPDRTVATRPGTPVTIQLECTDTGPDYEKTDPNGFVDTQPANGRTSDDAPTANPSTVTYTPDPGFTGTDRLVYNAFDDYGFGTDKGTVTIRVEAPAGGRPAGGAGGAGGAGRPKARPKCEGRAATIVGTSRRDRIKGTRRRDVIVAGAGNDRVSGGRGNDLICGGSGNDRLSGGTGRDRVSGGTGRDRIDGGRGRDACLGGSGRDRASACERRRGI